jgi:hypothetical protein
MTSTVKVNNVQASDGGNIINQCGTNITIGASGDTIALASGASQTGFGRTGTVDWDTTAKTAGFTGVSGNGYFIDTTSGAITVNLPASPSAGDIMAIADYAGTAATSNIIIGRNGSNIEGQAANGIINNNRDSITLVYVDGTQGWLAVNDNESSFISPEFITATGGTITTVDTDFKVHTFTGPGTFCVSCAGNVAGSNTVSYMVVAGGASGTNNRGGGGGAGGYRESKAANDTYTASPLNATSGPTYNLPVTATGFPITVGGGGASIPSSPPNVPGNNGNNSIFSTITSTAGGGGGYAPNPTPGVGNPGGSGGGSGYPGKAGGSGNTPSVSPPQGQNGGNTCGSSNSGSGGGGAGGTGGNAGDATAGNGGNGVASSITGSPVTRAGGGGGASCTTGGSAGPGGGGAGYGGPSGSNPNDDGTTNTGGGGGASRNNPSGSGGSGIVVIRYKFQ